MYVYCTIRHIVDSLLSVVYFDCLLLFFVSEPSSSIGVRLFAYCNDWLEYFDT